MDHLLAWSGMTYSENLANLYTLGDAMESCQSAVETGRYIDVHCWIFTPESFFSTLRTLIHLDLFDYKVVRFYPTKFRSIEFYVSLEKLPPFDDCAQKRRIQLNSLPSFRNPTRSIRSAFHEVAQTLITSLNRLRAPRA
jgi:hypothetical protein